MWFVTSLSAFQSDRHSTSCWFTDTHTLFKHTHSWCHVVSVWHWANTKYKHIGVNHGIGIHCVFSHLKLSAHWFNNQAADGDSRSMKHELVCDYYFQLLFLPANTQDSHGWVITKIQNMLSVMLPWNTVHLDCRITWNRTKTFWNTCCKVKCQNSKHHFLKVTFPFKL